MTRRLRLRGAAADLQRAVDRVYFACDVRGVLEGDGQVEVWIDGDLPSFDGVLPSFDGVVGEELPDDPRPWTGLEDDVPIHVAADLLVRPPWVDRPVDFIGLELVVPRGMAFGSGEHGSTQAALCALHACWPSVKPLRFADVGTGSGILALYAVARGATAVLACDIEPDSVAAAQALLPTAEVRTGGPAVFPTGSADLVVANLDARQLAAGLPAILELWSGRAPLVLSGLRPGEVEAPTARVPAPVVGRVERGDYVALTFSAVR